MEYSKEQIIQGMQNQAASAETPETFVTLDGAAQPREGSDLSGKYARADSTRFAGARLNRLMGDPEEVARTRDWITKLNQPVWNPPAT